MVAATATIAAVGGIAQADTLVADGDLVTAGAQTTINLGTVACGSPTSKSIALELSRAGKGNIFAAGSTVHVTAAPGNSALSMAAVDIQVPSGWTAAANNTLTQPVLDDLVLKPTTAGTVTDANVLLTGSGTTTDGKTYAPTTTLSVSWTAGPCSAPKTDTTTSIACDPVTYAGVAVEPCTATVRTKDTGVFVTSFPVSDYTNNVNAGVNTAIANATYPGNDTYNGSTAAQTTFTIAPANAQCTVSGYIGTYDGTAHGASGTCTGLNGTDLSPSLDLGASYTDVPGGDANWTFSAPNYASQSATAQIAIGQATSSTTISCPSSGVTYTGSELKPCTATVTGAGGLSQDVPVTYTDNTNAGTATATATWTGDTNHTGSTATPVTFTIDKATSTTNISCPTDPVTYSGSEQTPCTATVTGAGGLSEAVPVTYTDNVNAGTATAEATWKDGDANHTPSTATPATFTIAKAPSTTVVTCPGSVVFTGSAITPCTASVTGAGGLNQAVDVVYGNNTAVGIGTATASYEDANHLLSSDVQHFTILPWTLSGFAKPVDMGSVVNVVKGGSTVPLKFTVFAGSTPVTDVATLGAKFTVTKMACTSGTPSDDLFTTTGGTTLRYDTTAGQWIQNWQTPAGAGQCYTVTLTTADGSKMSAAFQTK